MSNPDQMPLLFEIEDESFLLVVKNDEFKRFEAAALTTRAQNMATLSTIATIVAQTSTAPFSLIDPYTAGLMAIGHAIDSLKLLDIEESDLTVQGLEAKVADDLTMQFDALLRSKQIEKMPARSDIEAWGKGIVSKLLCKKGVGKAVDSLFSTESGNFFDFQHSLLEEYQKNDAGGIYVRPTHACLTLYLGTLTQSVGDTQVAFAAVIQRQIRRGEYHAALQSALEHRRVTKQHCEVIRTLRRRVLSNASRYGWEATILPEIKGAEADVNDAMSTVTELERHLENGLDTLPRDKQSLAEKVLNVIRLSRIAYRELQAITMELPKLYSECIASQGFASRHIPLPSMYTDVFGPFFNEITNKAALLTACDAINSCFILATPPKLYDALAVTELLLKPMTQEEIRDDSAIIEFMDEEELTLSVFDSETINKAIRTIKEKASTSPAKLSEIIALFCEEDFFEESICSALIVSGAWTHGRLIDDTYIVARTYNKFECTACSGDDFIIYREEAGS
jgi:hypothetical protein